MNSRILRCAVCGTASNASLIIGVAAAAASTKGDATLAGAVGMFAGAVSMAAGEYLSKRSQVDTELTLSPRKGDQTTRPAAIGQFGGSAAREMRQHGSLPEHALGVATTTALSFACGAVVPLAVFLIGPGEEIGLYVPLSTMILLGLLGAYGVESGRSNRWLEGFHLTLWGAAAMFATSLVGTAFNLVL